MSAWKLASSPSPAAEFQNDFFNFLLFSVSVFCHLFCFSLLLEQRLKDLLLWRWKTLQRTTWYLLVGDKRRCHLVWRTWKPGLAPGWRLWQSSVLCCQQLRRRFEQKSSQLTWCRTECFSPAAGVSDWHAKRGEDESFQLFFNCISNEIPLFVCCSSLLLQCSTLSDQSVCSYYFGMEKSKGSPFCKEGLWKGSLFFHQSCWKPSFPSLFPSPAPTKLTSSCLCRGSVNLTPSQ